jgi:DNA-binding NarL/FixJ family response regulator
MDSASQSQDGRVRILIIDDHSLMRRGLRELIDRERDLEVCGEAESARTALDLLEQIEPDVVIMDLTLTDLHGLDLIGQVKNRYPDVRIVVLSMHDEKLYAERCLRAGASGYVQKRDAPEKVIRAIRSVLAGQVYVSDDLAHQILRRIVDQQQSPESSPFARLSDRELQLLELIGQGMTTREIADHLHLSVKTVHTYRENLKAKLDLENVYQLVRFAVAWTLKQE